MNERLTSFEIFEGLQDQLSLIPDGYIAHEGDCAGTYCPRCRHCCHSYGECHCKDRACGCEEAGYVPLPEMQQNALILLGIVKDAYYGLMPKNEAMSYIREKIEQCSL